MPVRDEVVAQLKDVMGTALDEWARSSHVDEVRDGLGLSVEEVVVTPDSVLVFNVEDSRFDLELSRLRNIIDNASLTAAAAYEAEKKADPGKQGANRRAHSRQMARLAVLRDSLSQVARLLNAEDLDQEPAVTGYQKQQRMFDIPLIAGIHKFAVMSADTTSVEKKDAYAQAIIELCTTGETGVEVEDEVLVTSSFAEFADATMKLAKDESEAFDYAGSPLDPIDGDKLKLAETHKRIRALASNIRNTASRPDPETTAEELEDIARYIRGGNNG